MILDAELFDFYGNLYSQELSTLQGSIFGDLVFANLVPSQLTLQNCPAAGQHRSFILKSADFSPSGDIAGWRFQEIEGPNRGPEPIQILIVND